MKFKGTLTAALTSLAIFFAFAVAGGICLATGFGEYASNSEFINNVNDLYNYVEQYVDDFDNNSIASGVRTQASYERVLSMDSVDTIVIDASGCAVDINAVSSDMVSVNFNGLAASGANTVFDDYSTTADGEIVFDSSYYAHDGVIKAELKGSELHISLATARIGGSFAGINFGINSTSGIGDVKIALPVSFTGNLEIKNSVDDIVIDGFTLENFSLTNCAGETDISRSTIGMLAVKNLAGEVDANGTILGVDFRNVAGEIKVETSVVFDKDSIIEDIAGEIEIDLPYGSALNITKDSVLGMVDVNGVATGVASAPYLQISDVMGEVTVEIAD